MQLDKRFGALSEGLASNHDALFHYLSAIQLDPHFFGRDKQMQEVIVLP